MVCALSLCRKCRGGLCGNLSFLQSILVNIILSYRPLNMVLYLSYPCSIVEHQVLVGLIASWRLARFNTDVIVIYIAAFCVRLCQENLSSARLFMFLFSFCSFNLHAVHIYLILRCFLVLRSNLKIIIVLYYLIVELCLLTSQGNNQNCFRTKAMTSCLHSSLVLG